MPDRKVDEDYCQFSGTSVSVAQISGVVALMLADNSSLTPDQVAYCLRVMARPALDENGNLVCSIFQQGASRVSAYDVVHNTDSGYANQGMNIAYDRDGPKYYGGRGNRDGDGNYYVMDVEGYAWGG